MLKQYHNPGCVGHLIIHQQVWRKQCDLFFHEPVMGTSILPVRGYTHSHSDIRMVGSCWMHMCALILSVHECTTKILSQKKAGVCVQRSLENGLAVALHVRGWEGNGVHSLTIKPVHWHHVGIAKLLLWLYGTNREHTSRTRKSKTAPNITEATEANTRPGLSPYMSFAAHAHPPY